MSNQNRLRERMRLHLRAEIDGGNAIQQIAYLTYCLATGYETPVSGPVMPPGQATLVPLDDLRTKQVIAALGSYHRTLTRVLPDLKAMDLAEALAPSNEGKDFDNMDRLELANRLRVVFGTAFKQLTPPEVTDEEFMR